MLPLTRDTLAANAFRTLGLPATATQGAIDAAARRMRIWPDPARIPATAWDLPWLGPIGRTKGDIEGAVARLTDPAQRVAERTLWYHGAAPPADAAAAVQLTGADALVGTLHAAIVTDPEAKDLARWRDVLGRWSGASADELARAEADGGFEKRSSPAELSGAMAAVPAALAEAMAGRAREAWAAGDGPRCQELGVALREAGFDRAVAELIDRIEDEWAARAAEVERVVRAALSIDHANPEPYRAKNRETTVWGEWQYNRNVEPPLYALTGLIGPGEANRNRKGRVRARCAELKIAIALGWEWAGDPVSAESCLKAAIQMAKGTATEMQAEAALARVQPLADAERARLAAVEKAGVAAAPVAVIPVPVVPVPLPSPPPRAIPKPTSTPVAARKRRMPVWVDRLLMVSTAVLVLTGVCVFSVYWADSDAGKNGPSAHPPAVRSEATIQAEIDALHDAAERKRKAFDGSGTVPPGVPPLHVDPLSVPAGEVNRDPW